MITRTTLKSAAAALFLTAALTGCGDSSDDQAAAPATSATTATTPGTTPDVTFEQQPQADPSKPAGKKETAWAAKLCTALVGSVESVKPPTVAASTPEATLKSLTTFFESVVDQQDVQLKTLEDVGPPPTNKAEGEWQKAIDQLKSIRGDVNGVVDGLKGSKATSEADITKLITSLQGQLKSLGSYSGPIKELFASETVGQALLAEPACQKVA